MQLVGGEVGHTYEVKTCIVACGVSLANTRDLGEWMGTPSHAIFNFSPRTNKIGALTQIDDSCLPPLTS